MLVAVLAAVVTACSNTPPPPVVSTPIAQTSVPDRGSTTSRIVVGMDRITGGYNPHNLADASPVTSALSELMLPSVFRRTDDGTFKLDKTLMASAKVTKEKPFTVAYRIRPEASWSDGAPIAVEDFVYLADAMKTQPGVVNPAGYQLISDIRPGEGGKLVTVRFRERYPGWKTLFNDLLPSHLLKDAPGGWQSAFANGFPASGGPFAIKTIDAARGEIVLHRNERYWEKPAAVDRLVLHRSDPQDMVASLRTGHQQFVLTDASADTRALLSDLGDGVSLHTVARPYIAEILLRPLGPTLGEDTVRAAVTAFIDRQALIETGTRGGASAELRADSQVVPPSAEDYAGTIPDSGPPLEPDPERARKLLTEIGYEREAGSWMRGDQNLSVVVAAPGDREPYASIAEELSKQLIAEGIEVTTVNPPPRKLFAQTLPASVRTGGGNRPTPTGGQVGIDIAVVPRAVGSDPASTLASSFGCAPDWESSADSSGDTSDSPASQAEPGNTADSEDGGSGSDSGSEPGSDSGNATDRENSGDKTTTIVPANPAGFCDTELQPTIDAALTGEKSAQQSRTRVEAKLWESNVSIPLFQLSSTLAVGSGVSEVSPGPPLSGPFTSAVAWTRAPR